jgi:Protein of unknown function (DUF998)
MDFSRSASSVIVLAGIVCIAAAMLIGPFASPAEFNWIIHTTSEQAAQHMPGAWIMRAGFVGYGASIVAAGWLNRCERPFEMTSLIAFGLGLVASAVWSNAPIVPGVPGDLGEDRLHSIASGVVGTAFALACGARWFETRTRRIDRLAALGIAIAVLVPLAMAYFPATRGLLQRAMFAFSFIFVLNEFALARSQN